MGRVKNEALKELEEYMNEFDFLMQTESDLTEADLDDFWEDFSAEALEDSKVAKKEEVKKKDSYYEFGPKIIKQTQKEY